MQTITKLKFTNNFLCIISFFVFSVAYPSFAKETHRKKIPKINNIKGIVKKPFWTTTAQTVAWYGNSSSLSSTLVTLGRFASASNNTPSSGVGLSIGNISGASAQVVTSVSSTTLAQAQANNDYFYSDLVVGTNGLRIDLFAYNQVSANNANSRMQVSIIDMTTSVETILTNPTSIAGSTVFLSVPLLSNPQLVPGRTYQVRWYFFNTTGATTTIYVDNPYFNTSLNEFPTANLDTYNSTTCGVVSGNLTSNDTDPDTLPSQTLTIDKINGASYTVGSNITLTNGTLNISNATTGAFTFTPNSGFIGSQTFTYGINDGYGGTSSTTVTVTFTAPVQPTLSSVTQPTCSTATGSFTITNYNATYTYTFTPSIGVSNSAGTVTAPSGSYTVRASLGACTSIISASATVNAQPSAPSTPTVASTIQPTCSLTTGTIVFTTQSGVEYSVDNGATYQLNETFAGLLVGTYTLKVRNLTDATCITTAASTVTLVAASPTIAGTVSSNQAICSGTSPSDLTLSGNTGAVLKWQKSTDTAFTSPIDITNTSTTLTGALIGNLSATTYFRAVVQNGTCTIENSNYITITISESTWNGTSWSNGIPTITTTAFMTGNYSEATDLFACTLTVSNNAVVSIPSGFDVTLNRALTVNTGSSFTLNNNANLLQQTEVANAGTISVKRYTAPLFRLDYNLWSSPLIGSQTLMNFSPSTSNIPPTNIRFYTYNTTTNLYNSVTPTSTTFDSAKGYLIRMPNNWISYGASATPASWLGTFTGTPRNGALNYTLVNTGATTSYNAVGNPYPSALLLDNFITDNSSNIEGTLWFWRKVNDNNNLISYSTCSTIGCTFNNNVVYTNDNLISIGQGFIVKAKTGQTNVNFTNAMRSSDNVNQFFKNNNTQTDRYWLKLTNTANISTGQNLIAYVPDATNSYDNGLDGLYLNDGAVAFYSVADTKEVVINARPIFEVNDVIPLVFKTNVADTYTFSVNQKEGLFNGSQDIYIRDNFTNSVQNLTLGNYTFTSDIGEFASRFDILYQNSLSVSNSDFNPNQVIIYNKDKTIFVNTGNTLMNSLKIFDIRGRLLFNQSEINDTKTSIKLDTENQVLLLQITSQNGQVINKKIMN